MYKWSVFERRHGFFTHVWHKNTISSFFWDVSHLFYIEACLDHSDWCHLHQKLLSVTIFLPIGGNREFCLVGIHNTALMHKPCVKTPFFLYAFYICNPKLYRGLWNGQISTIKPDPTETSHELMERRGKHNHLRHSMCVSAACLLSPTAVTKKRGEKKAHIQVYKAASIVRSPSCAVPAWLVPESSLPHPPGLRLHVNLSVVSAEFRAREEVSSHCPALLLIKSSTSTSATSLARLVPVQ